MVKSSFQEEMQEGNGVSIYCVEFVYMFEGLFLFLRIVQHCCHSAYVKEGNLIQEKQPGLV